MFRYASFNRPLWIGFDPGTAYQRVDIKDSDILHGRRPHDVIETLEPIFPSKIEALELTDYQEVAATNKLYAYASEKLRPSSYLNCINDLIRNKTIRTTSRIDYYVDKVQKIQEARKETPFHVRGD